MPDDTVPVPTGACIDAAQILRRLLDAHPAVARQIEAYLCPDDDERGRGFIADTAAALEAALGD